VRHHRQLAADLLAGDRSRFVTEYRGYVTEACIKMSGPPALLKGLGTVGATGVAAMMPIDRNRRDDVAPTSIADLT